MLLLLQVKNVEAINYLERNLDRMSNDAYVLSITTYALHLSGSAKKDDALKLLEKHATEKG